MSDTPQNDSVDSEVIEPVIETNDSAVESDTTTPVEGESEQQVDEVELAKKKSNDAFNKQYGTLKQSERDLATANDKIAAFEQTARDRQAEAVKDIPPMPDSFDDNFDEKVRLRDEAIIAQTKHNTQNESYLQQQQNQQLATQQAEQAEFSKKLQSYNDRAVELGIKSDELQVAANVVGNYGLSDDLIKYIVSDSDGPLITKHLAANPMEASELIGMNPFDIGNKLNQIKANASALKPKKSNTPDPVEVLQGSSVGESKHPNLDGVTYS